MAKPSLAIVVSSTALGTGFCIASTSIASYYLTNQHVVGNDKQVLIFRQFPKPRKYSGTVIATGIDRDPDLAIVRVPVPNIPRLALQLTVPTEGNAVITAGYPSAQYKLAEIAGDLTPSVHVGTLSAVVNRGGLLEFDAQTLPGNSGGPLLDARTGNVLGVVTWKIKESTDANIAIGIGRVIAPFLKANGITYLVASPSGQEATPSSNSAEGTMRVLPGADAVVVVYDDSQATGGAGPAIAASARDFARKFSEHFKVHTSVLNQHVTGTPDLVETAKTANALFAVPYGGGFHVKSDNSNQFGISVTYAFELTVSVIDTYGVSWLDASKSKDALTGRGMYDAVVSSFADLNDQAIAEMDETLHRYGNDESISINFFRYAMPIANGAKAGFVSYSPSAKGAIVSVAPFSPAAAAGLQTGDIITSINGVSVVGNSALETDAIVLAAYATGRVDLTIVDNDGHEQHIKFSPKDLRWFIEHRESSP